MGGPENIDWGADEYWQTRRLSPAQLLVHDVRLVPWTRGNSDSTSEPWIEINETLSGSYAPDLDYRDRLAEEMCPEDLTNNRQEQSRLRSFASEYGWMNCLRSKGVQNHLDDPDEFRKCRWIHISSKFPEYLQGCFLALSDWNVDSASEKKIVYALRRLEECIYQNERFSTHGRYFWPFYEPLGDSNTTQNGPMLISVPFLDWTSDDPPPLRFQIDPREGFHSSRSTSHILRSLLQHYYRLENTTDREHHQVFSRHKPWLNDRDLDLKVRRWYGQYPQGLVVDELWVLVVDSRHIVTFSSNQSWKSRWPPLQLASRIMEVSFRGVRNSMYPLENQDYNAYTHTVVCLSGALGILHRSFWSDLPLCLTDRFAGYLSHLQYRLLRSPSTKLVMDLLQVQEELNIIIQIMQQQLDLVSTIQGAWNQSGIDVARRAHSRASSTVAKSPQLGVMTHSVQPMFNHHPNVAMADPMQHLLDNLRREFLDLSDLLENSNNMVNRTIQLVNIRLEDHGKAILVFTIVTIVFLPLSFVSSFFGMNTADIRNMKANQSLFWIVSLSLTVGVVGFAVFLAFYGGSMVEAFFLWKANHFDHSQLKHKKRVAPQRHNTQNGFKVLNIA